MNVTLGANVTVEVTARPRSEAARKTLLRVFGKDPAVKRLQRQRKAKRPSFEEWRRGAAFWHHQMKSRSPVKLERGSKYTVHASYDVVRDLESVAYCVKVTPSK
jgi:hypothetical protein